MTVTSPWYSAVVTYQEYLETARRQSVAEGGGGRSRLGPALNMHWCSCSTLSGSSRLCREACSCRMGGHAEWQRESPFLSPFPFLIAPFSFPSPSLRSTPITPSLPCHFLLSLPFPLFPSPSLTSLSLRSSPWNLDRRSGERCKLSQRGLWRSLNRNGIWWILASKYAIWYMQQVFSWESTYHSWTMLSVYNMQ